MDAGVIVLFVIVGLIVTFFYCGFGYLIWSEFIEDALDDITDNPLWTPFAALLWPVTLIVIWIFMGYWWFEDWIKLVIKYYRGRKK